MNSPDGINTMELRIESSLLLLLLVQPDNIKNNETINFDNIILFNLTYIIGSA